MNGRYELLYEGKADGVIPVFKYRSKDSGLTVAICQVEGPLVNGYFCLGTEAHDDDGLPHTLEHLVFMGSEEYPYKGVLDLLANRCLASGTNAWTDTDHTCYTMTNAGSEGFLQLLPIYMDHVLYPTLTEAAYITEVHHINEEGEDAGVVYCEMQARENTGDSRTHLAFLRAMYPGKCGYKSETGGILENLRTSTSHTKVVNYHKEFYRPENLCIIVTGQVQPEEVFQALDGFEKKIQSKGARSPFTKPWQSAVPPLQESVNELVKFSSDDEETGMVIVGWRGPRAKDQYTLTSIMIVMEYLTETAIAPLQREFVEIEDPLCSKVRYTIIENSETCVYIKFSNVPIAKLGKVKPKLAEVLQNIGNQTETIDTERMQSVIHRRILEAMSNLEDNPHETLSYMVIGDFLSGETKADLDTRINQIKEFKKLKNEKLTYWVNLLNKFFIGTKDVTIIGEPSKQLMEETGTEEKERIRKQAEELGEEGLEKKGEILENATDANEEEPPEEMLTAVPVPSVESIHFHKITPATNADSSADKIAKFPLSKIPVLFQLDDIQSKFADICILMNADMVPKELKLYFPLMLELLLESPVMRDGNLIEHEEIIKELAKDTLSSTTGVGCNGSKFGPGLFSQVVHLALKVEYEKYEKVVHWARELLYQTSFTADRIKVIATRLINDITSLKRKGSYIVDVAGKDIFFNEGSNKRVCCVVRQQKFLSEVVKKLETPELCVEVIKEINQVRSLITTPANLRVHLATHVQTLTETVPSPQLPWQQNFIPEGLNVSSERLPVKSDREFCNAMGEGPTDGVILGVGSVDSNYLSQAAPLPLTYDHPDLAALHVFIQYLTQLEGPMWRQIRGLGLSYHYSMAALPDPGLMKFILYKSTHLVNAYKQAKEIVDGYLNGTTEFSEVELESCRSSLIFELIEEEETPEKVSGESMIGYFRGTGLDYNKKLIKAIPKVTLEDMKRVGQLYVAPLFDPAKSKVAICCHPTKVEEITKEFKEMSRELMVIDNMDESFLAEY